MGAASDALTKQVILNRKLVISENTYYSGLHSGHLNVVSR